MAGILNINLILKVISLNMFITAIALLICIPVGIYYNESTMAFIVSSVIAMVLGLIILFFSGKRESGYNLHVKDTFITVTVSWLTISLTGSLPYLLSGAIPSFSDAFFESVSGFTTTGSSILTDIESLPMSVLFWRSLTHWIGGIGIIVLVILIMPKFRIGGYHLFTLESSLQERIAPNVKKIGQQLLIIYIFLTVTEIILLHLGNMSIFESVCHAFGTVATGGFSPRNTSIGGYSHYIQYVIMVFMMLGGANFVIHYYILRREFRKIKRNEELKFYLLVIFIIGSVITAGLHFKMGKPVEESFRESFFQVISILTCTGFSTADYLKWPVYLWVILFLSMFIGGSTGSTAGGIKMARHLIVLKNIKATLRRIMHPNAVIPVKLNMNTINDKMNSNILSFVTVYLMIFVAGTLLITFMGVDISTSGGSVATCMAGIGPGIGTVGPSANFAHLPVAAKLLLSALMIFGRLEIYPVLVLFSRDFWRS